MTLRTSIVITGDTAQAQAALDALATQTGEATAAAEALDAAAGEASAGIDRAGGSAAAAAGDLRALEAANAQLVAELRQAQAATASLAAEFTDARNAIGGLETELRASQAALAAAASRIDVLETRLRSLGQTSDGSVKSAAQQRQGMLVLGEQFRQFSTEVALGISPLQAFEQQSGQAAFALTMFGGKLGAVGDFLAGPWGIALTLGTTLAMGLASSMLSGADAADTQKDATDALTDAVKRLNSAAADEDHSTRQGIIDDINRANSLRLREIQTRKTLEAELELSKQKVQGYTIGGQFEGSAPGTVSGASGALAAGAQSQADDIAAQIAEQDKKIADAQKGIRVNETKLALRDIAAATDKATAATQRYGDALDKLERRFQSGQIDKATFEKDALAITKERDAALEAAKAHDKAAKSTRDHGDAANALAGYLKDLNRFELNLSKTVDQLARDLPNQTQRIAAENARIKDILGDGGFDDMFGPMEQAFSAAEAESVQQRQDAERELYRQQVDDLRSLSSLYDDLFSHGTKSVWDDFKQIGREVLAELAAEWTLGALGGSSGLGGSLLSLLTGGRSGGGNVDLAGSLASALGLGPKTASAAQNTPATQATADAVGKSVGKEVGHAMDGIFGKGGTFASTLRNAGIGYAAGSLTGSGEAGALGGAIGGAVGTKLLSGLLGSAAGPLGSIAGGLLGGIIGGLFKKTKQGGVVLTGADTAGSTFGNSSAQIAAAGDASQQVQQGLDQIAQQLGGTLGAFNVSIGTYNGKWRVNPNGGTKLGGGGGTLGNVDFGKDGEADAVAYAIMDAVKDGAVTGLSAAVQQALKSSTDIDQALQEALKVQQVETLIEDIGDKFTDQFKSLETEAQQRLDIAKKYGLDVVAVEKANANDRLALEKQLFNQEAGSLQSLVDSITGGDLFEGTAVDQRNALLGQIDKAQQDFDNGVDGAGDTLANLLQQFDQVSKSVYGTTGGFAADQQAIIDKARADIAKTNAQIAAAEKAAGIDPGTAQTNAALDENNDQNAKLIAGQTTTNQLLTSISKTLSLPSNQRLIQLARTS